MNKNNLRTIAHAAIIAALYVVLTYVSALFGLASGAVQLRLSEALVVLPVFMPSAVPGLFVGCILSNLLTGCAVWDIVFGSLATLIGAVFTRMLRNKPLAALVPPILANTIVVPPVIWFVYGSDIGLPLVYLGVFAGEVLSCGVLGYLLYRALRKVRLFSEGNLR